MIRGQASKETMELRVAQTVPDTEAEGPGHRFALWVQGCTLNCPGCCNPEMFGARGGALVEAAALAARIVATPGLEGLSVLGGEPFQQAAAVAEVCATVRAAGRSVMVYSGYTLEELRALPGPGPAALLAQTDLLVDGRYERELPERRRRWLGSANQRLHFLTGRYREDDPRFLAPNTVELRLVDGQLTVNGWPAAADALRRR
jgi:anaerobic ribonucleoside-triphosphate reductase activating protein